MIHGVADPHVPSEGDPHVPALLLPQSSEDYGFSYSEETYSFSLKTCFFFWLGTGWLLGFGSRGARGGPALRPVEWGSGQRGRGGAGSEARLPG